MYESIYSYICICMYIYIYTCVHFVFGRKSAPMLSLSLLHISTHLLCLFHTHTRTLALSLSHSYTHACSVSLPLTHAHLLFVIAGNILTRHGRADVDFEPNAANRHRFASWRAEYPGATFQRVFVVSDVCMCVRAWVG